MHYPRAGVSSSPEVLTTNLVPFFAGTYYPPDRFRSLVDRVYQSWKHDRQGCEETGRAALAKLREAGSVSNK